MTRLRPFERRDLDALYMVSLATGLAGGDAAHLYRDAELMGSIYAAPYALLDPGLAFVAEDQDGVAGYIVGTADTRDWEERLEREWWPTLRLRHANPSGTPLESWNADQRRAFMIHHPVPAPSAIADRYPAHLHMNLLPRTQGRGFGQQLFALWCDAALQRSVQAMHVGVNRANGGAARFWSRLGFQPLSLDGLPEGRTLWMGRDCPRCHNSAFRPSR